MLTLKQIIYPALIIILGSVVYSNSLDGEFVWDDQYLVKDNVYIKSFSYLPRIFIKDYGEGGGVRYGFYRPLQTFTYMIDYAFWKLNQKGYHLTSILIHILAALSIFWLIDIIFGDKLVSLLASLTFVIHPIHTETVAYISGRQESLAALFILLCLIFYIKYLRSENKGIYLLMLVNYILAILSKEVSLIVPLIMVLYNYSFKKKLRISHLLPIIIISFIYILLRLTLLRHLFQSPLSASTNILQRTPGFFVALTNYLKLLILPLALHMGYGNPLFKITDPRALLGLIMFFSLLLYALRIRKSNSLVFFSIGWFFITLLPASNLYPLSSYMREHWLYLPSIGFFIILAKVLSSLYRRKHLRIFTVISVISLLLYFSLLTLRQNSFWRKPPALYERMLECSPFSSDVYNNLGKHYSDEAKTQKAIEMFKKALRTDPDNAVAYNNLAAVYSSLGRNKEAIELYRKSIEIKPAYVRAYSNLAVAYIDIGNKEDAIRLLKKAMEINPDYSEAYFNLAVLCNQMGKKSEAIRLYKKTVEINPHHKDAYFNLALLFLEVNKKKEAINFFKKAMNLNPNDAEIYYNLGIIYTSIGRNIDAIKSYKKAIEIKPDYAEAHNNLSVVYLQQRQYHLAIKYCDKAKELGLINQALLEALKPYRDTAKGQ